MNSGTVEKTTSLRIVLSSIIETQRKRRIRHVEFKTQRASVSRILGALRTFSKRHAELDQDRVQNLERFVANVLYRNLVRTFGTIQRQFAFLCQKRLRAPWKSLLPLRICVRNGRIKRRCRRGNQGRTYHFGTALSYSGDSKTRIQASRAAISSFIPSVRTGKFITVT